MKKKEIAKLLILAFILFFGFTATSQDCAGISVKKDKQQLTETYSGLASSDEFYSLLISKKISKSGKSIPTTYELFLNVASRVLFDNSELQTTGSLTFSFVDSPAIVFENVYPSNNPMGFCCTLGFTLELSEEQFSQLVNKTILRIKAFNKVTATYSGKKQRKLQNMLSCLISKA